MRAQAFYTARARTERASYWHAMTGWQGLVAMVCVLAAPCAASAQTVEISPFGGYRFGGGFFERVTGQDVDLDGTGVVGGTVNVALYEGLWIEGLFTHQRGRVSVPGPSGMPPTRWNIDVDHWMAGGLQE